MEYKFIVDRGRLPLTIKKIEVNQLYDEIHTRLLKVYPYDPPWWNRQQPNIRNSLAKYETMSQSYEEALERADEYYSSLPYPQAPSTRLLLGRID